MKKINRDDYQVAIFLSVVTIIISLVIALTLNKDFSKFKDWVFTFAFIILAIGFVTAFFRQGKIEKVQLRGDELTKEEQRLVARKPRYFVSALINLVVYSILFFIEAII